MTVVKKLAFAILSLASIFAAGTLIFTTVAGTEVLAGTQISQRQEKKSVPAKSVPARRGAAKGVPAKVKSAEELAREAKEAFAGTTCWPVGELHSAAAKFCRGNVYFAPMSMEQGGPLCMTFSPASRTHWIIHHGRERVLICVAGTGWVQTWGDRAVKLSAGDVIFVDEGVKHWIGAGTTDAGTGDWFQVLTYDSRVWRGWRDEACEEVEDDWVERLK